MNRLFNWNQFFFNFLFISTWIYSWIHSIGENYGVSTEDFISSERKKLKLIQSEDVGQRNSQPNLLMYPRCMYRYFYRSCINNFFFVSKSWSFNNFISNGQSITKHIHLFHRSFCFLFSPKKHSAVMKKISIISLAKMVVFSWKRWKIRTCAVHGKVIYMECSNKCPVLAWSLYPQKLLDILNV